LNLDMEPSKKTSKRFKYIRQKLHRGRDTRVSEGWAHLVSAVHLVFPQNFYTRSQRHQWLVNVTYRKINREDVQRSSRAAEGCLCTCHMSTSQLLEIIQVSQLDLTAIHAWLRASLQYCYFWIAE
jgi:hypothetical protein